VGHEQELSVRDLQHDVVAGGPPEPPLPDRTVLLAIPY
jgi:hypothetical protein